VSESESFFKAVTGRRMKEDEQPASNWFGGRKLQNPAADAPPRTIAVIGELRLGGPVEDDDSPAA
jgi:hypothetical protein